MTRSKRRRNRGHGRDREKDAAQREVKENSGDKEEVKGENDETKPAEVTFVEAPLPTTNPWAKRKKTAAEGIEEKKNPGKVKETDPPLEAASKPKKNVLKEKKVEGIFLNIWNFSLKKAWHIFELS